MNEASVTLGKGGLAVVVDGEPGTVEPQFVYLPLSEKRKPNAVGFMQSMLIPAASLVWFFDAVLMYR